MSRVTCHHEPGPPITSQRSEGQGLRLGWAPHTHYKIFPQHAGDSPDGVAEVAVKEGGGTGPTEADTNMRRGRMWIEREGGQKGEE